LERGQRVALTPEPEQRFAPADERRSVGLVRVQLERAIEMRQRRLRVLPRELQIAERRFGRIERRRRLQREVELALRRLQIAALQKGPAARRVERRRRGRQRLGNHRLPELRIFLVGDDRRRNDFRRARAGAHERRQEEPAHLTDSTAAVRVQGSEFRVQGSGSGSAVLVLVQVLVLVRVLICIPWHENRNRNKNEAENLNENKNPNENSEL